ncbi:S8 family serine peptidase [Thermus antranikianii]
MHLRVTPGQEREKAQELLQAGAHYVQPNYLYRPLRVPTDLLYVNHQKDYLDLIGLAAAWDAYTGDPQLVIAVVDTGYQNHADMTDTSRWYLPSGQILDLADNDQDPWDDTPDAKANNPFSHGLAVASVLGADTNNSLGMAGVTWAGKVVPLKVAHSADGSITTTTVAQAVQKAVALGAKVINLSLGAPTFDQVLENALVAARNQNVVLVAAAGNDGVDGILYPARSPAVIAVGSVDTNLSKSTFSNCGPELDLVAPGRGILVLFPDNGFGTASGTSFASPMVAGVAALYIGKYHQVKGAWPSADQVYQCLIGTAQDLGPSGHDTGYGFGLVRADRVMTDTTYCFP